MRGFIYIRPLGLGADILVGLAQIATVEPVQRKRRGPYFAELHLGDGRVLDCEESWDTVLDAIEAASHTLPAAMSVHVPGSAVLEQYSQDDPPALHVPGSTDAIAASAQQAEVKKEFKKRGRTPKADPQQ